MDWLTTALPLRLILLGAGFLFIVTLVWFDRRRRSQAGGARMDASSAPDDANPGAATGAMASGHSEPSLAAPAAAHEPHTHSAHRPLPVIDWQALEREQGASGEAGPRLAVHTMRPPAARAAEPTFVVDDEATADDMGAPPQSSALGATAASRDAQADPASESEATQETHAHLEETQPTVHDLPPTPVFLGEPSIDHWPSDDERLICSLRIAPRTYAVFRHQGHISGIGRTWGAIWSQGLQDAGLKVAEMSSIAL